MLNLILELMVYLIFFVFSAWLITAMIKHMYSMRLRIRLNKILLKADEHIIRSYLNDKKDALRKLAEREIRERERAVED